jgi:hypothetical protein
MKSPDRVALLQANYRLSQELGYVGFRHQYFTDPDAIKEWPDPAVRERELRNFWDNEQEGGFASYCACHPHESVEVLTAYHDHLGGLLGGGKDGQIDYYNRISELAGGGRVNDGSFSEPPERLGDPMADNDKRPDREFAQISETLLTAQLREFLGHTPNHEKPTLGLSPGSDILSPTQLKELFAEWRADYAAAKAERESPRPGGSPKSPTIDMGEPER